MTPAIVYVNDWILAQKWPDGGAIDCADEGREKVRVRKKLRSARAIQLLGSLMSGEEAVRCLQLQSSLDQLLLRSALSKICLHTNWRTSEVQGRI